MLILLLDFRKLDWDNKHPKSQIKGAANKTIGLVGSEDYLHKASKLLTLVVDLPCKYKAQKIEMITALKLAISGLTGNKNTSCN